jgi:hypothetical protein
MLYSLPSGDFHQIPVSTDSDGHILFDGSGAGKYVVGSLGSPRADRIIPDLVEPFQGYYSQVVDNIEPVNGNATVVNGQLVVYGNAGPAASDQISLSYSTNLNGNQLLTVTDNGTSDSFDLTTLSSVVINCRAAADTVTVQMTPAGYPPIGVTVEGGQGSDNLVVDDTANPAATNYTVTDYTVWRTYAGVVNFSSIEDVKINGGGDSDYHVQNTDPNASTEIYTGDGLDLVYVEGTQGPLTVNLGSNPNDSVELSPVAQSLDNLGGGVGVNGTVVNGVSQGTLILDDQNTPVVSTTNPDKTVTFTVDGGSPAGSGSVTRTEQVQGVSSTLTFGFINLAKLVINGGNTGNTFYVQSTDAGTPVTITAGTGQDRIDIGGATAETLDPIQGAVNVQGGGGNTTLNVYDTGNSSQVVYDLYATQITRTPWTPGKPLGSPTQTINYFNIADVNVYGGSYEDNWGAVSTAAGTRTSLYSESSPGYQNGFYIENSSGLLDDIHGPLALHGGGGGDFAVAGDYLNTVGHTYTLSYNLSTDTGELQRDGMAAVTYDNGILNLALRAANSPWGHNTPNTINLLSLGPIGASIIAGTGDTVTVGQNHSVAQVLGVSLISGPVKQVTVDDSGDTQTGQQVTIGNDGYAWGIVGLAPGRIYFNLGSSSNLQVLGGSPVRGSNLGNTFTVASLAALNLSIKGGTGNDTFQVQSQPTPGATLSLNGNGGTDTLVGPNSNQTWTIAGLNAGSVGGVSFSNVQNLTGGTGNDTFKFTSAGSVSGKVDGGGGTNTLDYSGDGEVAATVNLANGTATKTGGFAHIENLVGTTSSADKLIGPNTTNIWSITNNNAGAVGSFSFSAIKNLTGGRGEDVFVFSDGKSISGKIDGGRGNNWLDYAAYSTAVTVNLAKNTAKNVGGGIANIRNVRGGQGGNNLTGNWQGNILIGGAGPNTIRGGTGRSILIGDKGKDTVPGGSGNDILIAGYTDYDTSSLAHDQALDAILTEWQSADSYKTRITKIKAGVAGGYKFVWGTTVHDNSTSNANKLTGADEPGARNWFFANPSHTRTNKSPGEQLN